MAQPLPQDILDLVRETCHALIDEAARRIDEGRLSPARDETPLAPVLSDANVYSLSAYRKRRRTGVAR
jgi:hypothetical protein